MRVEVTQILTRWLSHSEYGINALMARMPRKKADGSGEWDAPPPIKLFDDTMKDVVNDHIQIEPPATPSIVSFYVGDTRIATKEERKIARAFEMASAFCTKDMAADVAIRLGGIAFRAQHQSMQLFNSQLYSKGYKELNGVKVIRVGEVTELPVAGGTGRSKMWGIIYSTLVVIDNFS